MLKAEQCQSRRTAYSYPAGGLRGSINQPEETVFPSTRVLDAHHHALLTSPAPTDRLLGYVSVVFWGHYAGANGRRTGYVWARTQKALDAAQGSSGTRIAKWLRDAAEANGYGQHAEAISLLFKEVPYLGLAFASKVCAFMAPGHCGVIDTVVAPRVPQFPFKYTGKYLASNPTDARLYTDYCRFPHRQAEALNALDPSYQWKDRDGVICKWRAIDVERALYA
jgi:hypothetical protein